MSSVHHPLPPSPSRPAAPRAERMSTVDEAWYQMDRPRSPMVVASLMEFDGVTDLTAFAASLTAQLLRHPRFHQRVVESGGHCSWVDEPELNIAYHVRQRVLTNPASDTELQDAVAHELEQSLDRSLPLWRVVLYLRGASRVAVLFRAHHAIADGVAMLRFLLNLADGGAVPEDTPGDPPHHGPLAGIIEGLEGVNSALEAVGEEIVQDLRHPDRLGRQLGMARNVMGAIARVVALPDDNPAALRRPLGGRRSVAWVHDLSLASFKRIAHMQNVTINDVFLTALSGAFRTALVAPGTALPEGQNLRVSVPINLRADNDGRTGNQFGLVLVDLPVGLEGWAARLDVIADRMAALKNSGEAKAVLMALGAAGWLPVGIERRLVELVGSKAAAVVSNLPGPRRTLALSGAHVRNIVFWPPQAGGMGIGVGMLSYAGRVSVGLSSDTSQLPHPRAVLEAFCAELKTMLGRSPFSRGAGKRTRISPAPQPTQGDNHGTEKPSRRGSEAPAQGIH